MTQALQQPPRFATLKPKYVASTTYNPRHDPDIFDDGAGGYVSLGDVAKHSGKLPYCRTTEPLR